MDNRAALVSDLDGTLLGDEAALERFAAWFSTVRGRVRLAYASGRFYDSVVDSIRTSALPAPDVVIGGVGTDMRAFPSGDILWTPDHDHAQTRCDGMHWDPDRVVHVLSSFSDLRPQPPEFQSRHKISYFLDKAGYDRIDAIRQSLRTASIAADMIYSSGRDLDVVPQGVNKGTTTAILARQWGIDANHVMVSGDSGNDMTLFRQGFRGIVVANAHAELRALRGESAYQSSAAFAEGVLEGVHYWMNRLEWRSEGAPDA
jgi:sucrose-6F-phosphate phosphohydrolase